MKLVAQFLIASTTLAIGLLSAPYAQAINFTDTAGSDVGELIGTAGDAGIVDGTGEIKGSIDTRTNDSTRIKDIFDVDLFKITIATAGRSTFMATSTTNTNLQINLFLFNGNGNPLVALDRTTFDFETSPGAYYLGIASDDSDALGLDAMGNLRRIAGNDSGVEFSDGVLAGWNRGPDQEGGYTIKISQVPTPALLPGLVGLGLKLMRRKQKENATSNLAIEV
jgi:hypothetical protein